jgi:hypothetical protein
MPSTTIANFDAGQIPDVSDEANFHGHATYVFEHMAAEIIPGINTNLDWMNAALVGAESLVDAIADLQLTEAPSVDGGDDDGGDFDDGAAIIGGSHTVTGDWVNGPLSSGASASYTATLEVTERAFSGGASVTQVLSVSGASVELYTRAGTGDPLAFSDWVSNVFVGTLAQATNLAAALAAYTLPTTDGDEGQVLTTDAEGVASWQEPASPALELITRTVLSGNPSTVAFTGFDNSVYDHYQVVFANVVPSGDNVALCLRMSDDGGSIYKAGTGNYDYALNSYSGDTFGPVSGTFVRLADDIGSASAEHGVSGSLWLYGAGLTKKTQCTSLVSSTKNNGVLNDFQGAGRMSLDVAVDAVQLFFDSGNIESGIISLYGMRNA